MISYIIIKMNIKMNIRMINDIEAIKMRIFEILVLKRNHLS